MLYIKHNPQIYIDGILVERIGELSMERSFKYVGVKIDENINFKEHVEHVHRKINKAMYCIRQQKRMLPLKTKLLLYNGLVKCHLDYCNIIWGHTSDSILKRLKIQQKKTIRCIAGLEYNAHTHGMFCKLNVMKLEQITTYQTIMTAYRIFNSLAPKGVLADFQIKENNINTRAHYLLEDSVTKMECVRRLPMFNIKKSWNSLKESLKKECSYEGFKTKIQLSLKNPSFP